MIRLVPEASFLTHTKILTRWNIPRAHLPGPSREPGQKKEVFFIWKWAGLEQVKPAKLILSSLWVYSWATWFIPRLQAVHLQAHQSRPANLLLLNLYTVSRFWLQLTIKTKLPTSERATQNKVRISGIPLADKTEAYYTASLRPVDSRWIAEGAWSPAWANGGPHRACSPRGLGCWFSVTAVNGQTEPKRFDFRKSHTIKTHSVSSKSSVLIHWWSVISISQSNFIRLS